MADRRDRATGTVALTWRFVRKRGSPTVPNSPYVARGSEPAETPLHLWHEGNTMSNDVYDRLASHMDRLPAGYPGTESGVELRILHRLFTPEEAELALHLTLIAETPGVIARRAGLPGTVAEYLLAAMERKPAAELRPVPWTGAGTIIQLAQARGLLRPPEMIRMLIRSGIDRLRCRD